MNLALTLLLALSAVEALAAPACAGNLHQSMEDLEARMRPLEEQAAAGVFDAQAPARAQAMEAIFLELVRSTSSYSKDPMWAAWLTESAEAACALIQAVRPERPDPAAAAAELKRIAALREKAHEHFRPGLFGRLERWLAKRRIRHHETSAPAAPVLPRLIVPVRPPGAGAP